MIFCLWEDKVLPGWKGNEATFIESGEYPVVRMFDEERVIVDISRPGRQADLRRTITLLRVEDGEFINE